MINAKVERMLNDLRHKNPERYDVVIAAREAIADAAPEATEEIKYGGFVFFGPHMFCGVFAYTNHVSVEFGRGSEMVDPHQVLEGNGQYRRHIKLTTVEDITEKHLGVYVRQALELS